MPFRIPNRVRIPARMSFWVTVVAYLGVMVAAGAPSPLYVVYQARWHFSAITLTTIFGVYAVALLATLLTVGGLSDTIGRKPVLVLGFVAMIAAMGVFAAAQGVAWLYAARILQGFSAGALLGALSAAMIDYAGPQRLAFASLANGAVPGLGMAIGALGTGALVQFAPAPRVLVYLLMAALFAVLSLAIAAGPESEPRRPGAIKALKPRMYVAKPLRAQFLATMPGWIVAWGQLGFTLSLTTTLAAAEFGITDHFEAGAVVGIVTVSAFLSTVITRNVSGRWSTITGGLVLLAATATTLVSLSTGSAATFFAGGVLTGLGVGAMVGGAVRTLSPLPSPAERGEFFASMYIAGYLAFATPAVIAGICIVHEGLLPTTRAYAVGVALLSLIAVAAAARPKTPAGGNAARSGRAGSGGRVDEHALLERVGQS
jgi:MFS family permease